jgi:hypothetical protein
MPEAFPPLLHDHAPIPARLGILCTPENAEAPRGK